MSGRKRKYYERGSEEVEDWVLKCTACKHHYVRANNTDEIHCAIKKGCKFEPFESKTERTEECADTTN